MPRPWCRSPSQEPVSTSRPDPEVLPGEPLHPDDAPVEPDQEVDRPALRGERRPLRTSTTGASGGPGARARCRSTGRRTASRPGGWTPRWASSTSSSSPASSSGRSSRRGVRSTRWRSGHGSGCVMAAPCRIDGPGVRPNSVGPCMRSRCASPAARTSSSGPRCPTRSPGPARSLIDVVASGGQPRRPAAAPGLLPAAAGRVRHHRAGVLRTDRRARRGRRLGLAGRRRGVRAARRRRLRREGRGAGGPATARPRRRRPRDGGRAARGGVHGVVERREHRAGSRPARRSWSRAAPAASGRTPSRWRRRSGRGWRPPRAPPDRLARCRELGADIVIDYHDDIPAELKKATDGHGADVILDNMGAKGLAANLDALADDGRLMIIGMQGGVKAELNINKLLRKRASITAIEPAGASGARARRQGRHRRGCARAGVAADRRGPGAPGRASAPCRCTDAREAHRLLDEGGVVGKLLLVR